MALPLADYAHPLSLSRAVRTEDGGWRFDKPSLFCNGPMPAFLERAAFREGRFAVEVAVKVTEFSPHDTMRIVTYAERRLGP